jgi:hypothetical protein
VLLVLLLDLIELVAWLLGNNGGQFEEQGTLEGARNTERRLIQSLWSWWLATLPSFGHTTNLPYLVDLEAGLTQRV